MGQSIENTINKDYKEFEQYFKNVHSLFFSNLYNEKTKEISDEAKIVLHTIANGHTMKPSEENLLNRYIIPIALVHQEIYKQASQQSQEIINKINVTEERMTPFSTLNDLLKMQEIVPEKKGPQEEEKNITYCKQYFNYANEMYNQFKKNVIEKKEIMEESSTINESFSPIITNMVDNIKEKKNTFWLQKEFPEINNLEEHNLDTWYKDFLNIKLKSWYKEKINLKNEYNETRFTFDGNVFYKMKYNPFEIKNNLELELFEKIQEMCKEFNNENYKQEFSVNPATIPYPCNNIVEKAEKNYISYPENKKRDNDPFNYVNKKRGQYYYSNYYKKYIYYDAYFLHNQYPLLLEKKNTENSFFTKEAHELENRVENINDKLGNDDDENSSSDELINECFMSKLTSPFVVYKIQQEKMQTILSSIFCDFTANKDFCYTEACYKNKVTVCRQLIEEDYISDILSSMCGGIDFNFGLGLKTITNCIETAKNNQDSDMQEFYEIIKSYIDRFEKFLTASDLLINEECEKNYKYHHWTKEAGNNEKREYILKECYENMSEFVAKQAHTEQYRSYFFKEPVLRQSLFKSCLLFQNGFYDHDRKNYPQGYTQYMGSLLRKLNILAQLRNEKFKESIKDYEDKGKLDEKILEIEKIIFKMILLEYNELHNFDEHWSMYYKRENIISEEIFKKMVEKTNTRKKILHLINNEKKEIQLEEKDLFENTLPEEKNDKFEEKKVVLDDEFTQENYKSLHYKRAFDIELKNKVNNKSSDTTKKFNLSSVALDNTKKKYALDLLHQIELSVSVKNLIHPASPIQYYSELIYQHESLKNCSASKFKRNFIKKIHHKYNDNNDKNDTNDKKKNNSLVNGLTSVTAQRHLKILYQEHAPNLKRTISSLQEGISATAYFWENIISLYQQYEELRNKIPDIRLQYYIQKEFDNLFERLSKNNNMIMPCDYNSIKKLQTILQKTKDYLKNHNITEVNDFCNEFLLNQELLTKSCCTSCKSYKKPLDINNLLTTIQKCQSCLYNFGYQANKKLEEEKHLNYFSLSIKNDDYEKFKTRFNAWWKEKTWMHDSFNIKNNLMTSIFFFSNAYRLFYFIEYDKNNNTENLISEDALAIKNTTLYDKNAYHFNEQVNIYDNKIKNYKKTKQDYFNEFDLNEVSNDFINFFTIVTKYTYVRDIIIHLLKQYADMEPSLEEKKFSNEFNKIWEEKEVTEMIKKWYFLMNHSKDNNNSHKLYVRYALASIIKKISSNYYDKFCDYWINAYKEYSEYRDAFVLNINKKEFNELKALKKMEENFFNDDLQNWKFIIECLNKQIASYEEIEISGKLIKLVNEAVIGKVSFTDLIKDVNFIPIITEIAVNRNIPVGGSENIIREKPIIKDEFLARFKWIAGGSIGFLVIAGCIVTLALDNNNHFRVSIEQFFLNFINYFLKIK